MLFNIATYWAKYSLHSQLNSPPQTPKKKPSMQTYLQVFNWGLFGTPLWKSLEEHTENPRIQELESTQFKIAVKIP